MLQTTNQQIKLRTIPSDRKSLVGKTVIWEARRKARQIFRLGYVQKIANQKITILVTHIFVPELGISMRITDAIQRMKLKMSEAYPRRYNNPRLEIFADNARIVEGFTCD